MRKWVRLLALGFIPAVGIVYATGFLVVLTFLETYGIRESGMEFWKGRYIHIGIIVLALPVIFNCTFYPLWIIRAERVAKPEIKITPPRILEIVLLLLNLQVACFVVIMFFRRAYSGFGSLFWIFILTIFGILGTVGLKRLLEWAKQSKTINETVVVYSRWALIIIIGIFDIGLLRAFREIIDEMLEFHTGSLILLLLLVFLLGLIPVIVSHYLNKYFAEHLEKSANALRILTISIIAPLVYFHILAFSYVIYPYVPASRGGGDYTTADKTVLVFKKEISVSGFKEILDTQLKSGEMQSIPLIVISETSGSLFAAIPKEAGGPEAWRKNFTNRPRVFEIAKDRLSHCIIKSSLSRF